VFVEEIPRAIEIERNYQNNNLEEMLQKIDKRSQEILREMLESN